MMYQIKVGDFLKKLYFYGLILLTFVLVFIVKPGEIVYGAVISSPEPYDFTNGLLDDDDLILSNDLPPEIYDNDLNTNNSLSNYESYFINFKYPVDIKAYYLDVNRFANLIVFYFSDGFTKIEESRGSTRSPGLVEVDYKNVIAVEVYKRSADTVKINEIEFFGTYDPDSIYYVPDIENVNYNVSSRSVHFTFDFPDDDISHVKVLVNDTEYETFDNNFMLSDLIPNTEYTFTFITVGSNGRESKGYVVKVKTLDELDPSKIPPSNVTALTVKNISYDSVEISWVNSNDDDLASVNIYVDGVLYENIPLTSNHIVKGLDPNTTYVIGVALVDHDGNVSGIVPVTVTTHNEPDNIPPNAPKNVNIQLGNSSLFVTWEKNKEPDLKGYNVYLNGEKINDKLIKAEHFTISNLENGIEYEVQVSAVDYSGNESLLSEVSIGIPDSSLLPHFKINYTLQDVSTGVSNLFSQYWLLIAFAASIPLSFYIASRIKLMLLD